MPSDGMMSFASFDALIIPSHHGMTRASLVVISAMAVAQLAPGLERRFRGTGVGNSEFTVDRVPEPMRIVFPWLERILGLGQSVHALEDMNQGMGRDLLAFQASRPAPVPETEALPVKWTNPVSRLVGWLREQIARVPRHVG